MNSKTDKDIENQKIVERLLTQYRYQMSQLKDNDGKSPYYHDMKLLRLIIRDATGSGGF